MEEGGETVFREVKAFEIRTECRKYNSQKEGKKEERRRKIDRWKDTKKKKERERVKKRPETLDGGRQRHAHTETAQRGGT
jgi:hypothetical protein